MRAVKSFIKSICLIISVILLNPEAVSAQILQPVKWNWKAEQKKGGETVVVMTAKIDKGWHLYSQNIADGGPIKTTFSFNPSPDYELLGKPEEGKAIEFYDKNFEMQLAYFANEAVFKQKVKLLTKSATKISGYR